MNRRDHVPQKSLELHPTGCHYPWKTLWFLRIQSKIKLFSSRTLHNKLLSSAYLSSLMLDINPQFICCRSAMESTDQLFAACLFSKHIWTKIPLTFLYPFPSPDLMIGFGQLMLKIELWELQLLGIYGRPVIIIFSIVSPFVQIWSSLPH